MIITHKSDFEAVEKYRELNKADRQKHIPYLLEWIQDMNWPVASNVLEILADSDGECLVVAIQKALQGDDGMWKYWIIDSLYPKLCQHSKEIIKVELQRICDNPTSNDVTDEVVDVARIVIKGKV